jgi:hypothetical protein
MTGLSSKRERNRGEQREEIKNDITSLVIL